VNTYHTSSCKSATDNCYNWCDDLENGNNYCITLDNSDDGCFLTKRCNCECKYKSTLSDKSKFTVPFEIKHRASGKCLDWWIRDGVEVGLWDCDNWDDQKWVYYPQNGAVISALNRDNRGVYNCLEVPGGQNVNGQNLHIWRSNECVNWESSQWTFSSNGHIRTHISWKDLDIENGGDVAQIWDGVAASSNQIFTFPAAALRSSEFDGACTINKLDKVEDNSVDEIAQTAWDIGTTVAGMIPYVGAPISIITSIWNPTEDNGPSATELVNDVRDEINDAIQELKDCIDAKVGELALELEEDEALDHLKKVTTRLAGIAGASGSVLTDKIGNLFSDFNGWIPGLFDDKDDYRQYTNLLPVYSSLASLWNVVTRQDLLVHTMKDDCNNFVNQLGITYARFQDMHNWIALAIDVIIEASIKIVSDDNLYWQWKSNQKTIFRNKYLAPVQNYIESLEDISPNLAMNKNQCEAANEAGIHHFPSPSSDNIINIYKYTKSNGDMTMSANQSSSIITSRGFTLDDGITYTLYDISMENTLPVYKKYRAESNIYAITTNKHYGEDNDFNIVSILGYYSTLPIQYTIRKKSDPTRCLEVNYGDNDNLFLGWCHGGANQQFRKGSTDSDGYYDIISEYNNECLDANAEGNGVVDNSDNIITWPCHGGDNQKWRIDGNIIRCKANGGNTCIDAGDSNDNVHIWDCSTSNNNQLFEFPDWAAVPEVSWTELSGLSNGLSNVSIGSDSTIVGVDYSGSIWKYNGESSWSQIVGIELVRISVGNANNIWGVRHNDIYRYDGNTWTKINGGLQHVSVGSDGTVWGVSWDNKIWRYNGNNGWTEIYGGLSQISVGSSNHIVGIYSGYIYKLSVPSSQASTTSSSWKLIGSSSDTINNGVFKYVDISEQGDIYSIDTNDRIYHYDYESGDWFLILPETARLKQMESNNGIIIGVNSDNKIWRGTYS